MQRRDFLASVLLGGPLSAACVGADQPPPRIATFQTDITPPLGSPLCHGNVAPGKRVVDPLTARGIVFIGDEKPIVICALDWVRLSNTGYDAWIEALAAAVGSVKIPFSTVFQVIASRLPLVDITPTWPGTIDTIILRIRLPRIILAGMVGAALSIAGATYQGLFRNPLADPYLIGVAQGAALGAVIGFLLPATAT